MKTPWIKRTAGLVLMVLASVLLVWVAYSLVWPPKEFDGKWLQLIPPVVVAIGFVQVGRKWWVGPGIDEITPRNLRCPELDEALRLARETMPDFIAEVERNKPVALVKFPMQTAEGMIEDSWGVVRSLHNDVFQVTCLLNPAEQRETPSSAVVDWQIVQPDGRLRGAYGMRAAFKYHERHGTWISPTMKKEKARLVEMV